MTVPEQAQHVLDAMAAGDPRAHQLVVLLALRMGWLPDQVLAEIEKLASSPEKE